MGVYTCLFIVYHHMRRLCLSPTYTGRAPQAPPRGAQLNKSAFKHAESAVSSRLVAMSLPLSRVSLWNICPDETSALSAPVGGKAFYTAPPADRDRIRCAERVTAARRSNGVGVLFLNIPLWCVPAHLSVPLSRLTRLAAMMSTRDCVSEPQSCMSTYG